MYYNVKNIDVSILHQNPMTQNCNDISKGFISQHQIFLTVILCFNGIQYTVVNSSTTCVNK